MEQVQGGQRRGDGVPGAAGNNGEWDSAVAVFDTFQNFGNGFELWENFEVISFLAFGHLRDRHLEALLFVQAGDDFGDGHASPSVEDGFAEYAVPFRECFAPGDIVERHGIGDGAITIEEIGGKKTCREF